MPVWVLRPFLVPQHRSIFYINNKTIPGQACLKLNPKTNETTLPWVSCEGNHELNIIPTLAVCPLQICFCILALWKKRLWQCRQINWGSLPQVILRWKARVFLRRKVFPQSTQTQGVPSVVRVGWPVTMSPTRCHMDCKLKKHFYCLYFLCDKNINKLLEYS